MSKKVKQKENRRVTGRRTFLLGSGMLLATERLLHLQLVHAHDQKPRPARVRNGKRHKLATF